MFGRIYEGSHLVLRFSVLGSFRLLIQSPFLLFVCYLLFFPSGSVSVGCIILHNYPFLLGHFFLLAQFFIVVFHDFMYFCINSLMSPLPFLTFFSLSSQLMQKKFSHFYLFSRHFFGCAGSLLQPVGSSLWCPVFSLVVVHRLQHVRVQQLGTQAQLVSKMWDFSP